MVAHRGLIQVFGTQNPIGEVSSSPLEDHEGPIEEDIPVSQEDQFSVLDPSIDIVSEFCEQSVAISISTTSLVAVKKQMANLNETTTQHDQQHFTNV
jgi:hypothetical protein